MFRISFSGNLAYEIAVPAQHSDAAIRAIIAAGAPHGIVAYGTESLSSCASRRAMSRAAN
ncbi:MAG: hypothetical protein WDN49_17740 [Acetobacteraceae bacterium]